MLRRTPTRSNRQPDATTPVAAMPPEVVQALALFRVVFRAAREHNAIVEATCGIGGPAMRALAIIDSQPRIGVTDLAAALMVRQPTASQIVDELEEAGLATRRRARHDQRVVQLLSTAKGRRTLARAPGPPIGALPSALAALPATDLALLHRVLDRLIRRLPIRDDAARFEPMALAIAPRRRRALASRPR